VALGAQEHPPTAPMDALSFIRWSSTAAAAQAVDPMAIGGMFKNNPNDPSSMAAASMAQGSWPLWSTTAGHAEQ